MGCNCTRARRIHDEIREPKSLASLKSKETPVVSAVPLSFQSLTVSNPYSHCNVLVYTESIQEFYYYFPNPYKKIGAMSFNLVSIHNEANLKKQIFDSLVYFIKSHQEIENIRKISVNYHYICVHVAISSVNLSEVSHLICISDIGELFNTLILQQSYLEKILREIFLQIDNNFDGNISEAELGKALFMLKSDIKPEAVREIMKVIDADGDGKVSYDEFTFWWKRGRQGGIDFEEITSAWSKYIKSILPSMSNKSRRGSVDNSVVSKKILISLQNLFNPQFFLSVNMGKSAKREEILAMPEDLLGLNLSEFWISFSLTGKSEGLVKSQLRLFEDTLNAIKNNLLTSTVKGIRIVEGIQIKVLAKEEKLLFAFIFDFGNQIIESLMFFENFAEMLKSPTDDFFSVALHSEKNIEKQLETPGLNFFDSLGPSQIEIKSNHWSLLHKLITPTTPFHSILQKFVSFEGNTELKDPNFTDFQPLMVYLRKIITPVKVMSKQVPILEKLLKVIEENFNQEFKIFIRYMNIGGEIVIRCLDFLDLIRD